LGEESDYYKNARGNLAFIYMQTQRNDLAETLYKEAINAHLNTEDKNDRSYRYNCFQLARVYAKLNQRDKALSFYLEAKNITEISEEHADWFEELLK
jgi:tetratricopeptide (TPR) repeat protein